MSTPSPIERFRPRHLIYITVRVN